MKAFLLKGAGELRKTVDCRKLNLLVFRRPPQKIVVVVMRITVGLEDRTDFKEGDQDNPCPEKENDRLMHGQAQEGADAGCGKAGQADQDQAKKFLG